MFFIQLHNMVNTSSEILNHQKKKFFFSLCKIRKVEGKKAGILELKSQKDWSPLGPCDDSWWQRFDQPRHWAIWSPHIDNKGNDSHYASLSQITVCILLPLYSLQILLLYQNVYALLKFKRKSNLLKEFFLYKH